MQCRDTYYIIILNSLFIKTSEEISKNTYIYLKYDFFSRISRWSEFDRWLFYYYY